MSETPEPRPKRSANNLRIAIIVLLIGWTYAYNVLIKKDGAVGGFFSILDTISDDFVLGTLVTVGVGLGIVAVFSFTKLYTQIIANIYSFRIIEDLIYEDLREGRFRDFWRKLIHFEDQPTPETTCPHRVGTLLISFSVIYVMSWVYVVLFSEALFFVSWSAGVDLPIDRNNLILLPTLALAIPFSARVMAYMRYPYAQDYADFMPGAVFVLLLVAALGALFASDDQVFFLKRVGEQQEYVVDFLKNGAFLAFIPVFFEGIFWIAELSREEARQEEAAALGAPVESAESNAEEAEFEVPAAAPAPEASVKTPPAETPRGE